MHSNKSSKTTSNLWTDPLLNFIHTIKKIIIMKSHKKLLWSIKHFKMQSQTLKGSIQGNIYSKNKQLITLKFIKWQNNLYHTQIVGLLQINGRLKFSSGWMDNGLKSMLKNVKNLLKIQSKILITPFVISKTKKLSTF